MAYISHLPKEPQPGCDPERSRWLAWCGSEAKALKDASPDDRSNACPACSKAMFKAKLKAENVGYRVGDNDERVAKNHWVKSARPIYGPNGEHYGYITFPKGWGGEWKYLPWNWRSTADHDSRGDQEDKPVPRLSYRPEGKSRNSMEHVLWEVPKLIADGNLQTRQAVVARAILERTVRKEDAARKVIEDAQRAIDREAFRVRTAAEHEHIATAVSEMLAEGKISNYQREGLLLLLSRTSVKLPEIKT